MRKRARSCTDVSQCHSDQSCSGLEQQPASRGLFFASSTLFGFITLSAIGRLSAKRSKTRTRRKKETSKKRAPQKSGRETGGSPLFGCFRGRNLQKAGSRGIWAGDGWEPAIRLLPGLKPPKSGLPRDTSETIAYQNQLGVRAPKAALSAVETFSQEVLFSCRVRYQFLS